MRKITGLLILLAIFGLNMSLLPIAKAEGPIIGCNDLGDPKKMESYIMTILEEKILAPGSKDFKNNKETEIFSCFRESTCTKIEDKTSCNQKYVETCTSSNTDKEQKMCQPVQVILAKSGAELLYAYVGSIYRWSAGTVGMVAVLYLVIGGVEIAASGGDDSRITKAKERIFQSIMGLVLLFLSALILYTINPNFFIK